MSTNTVESMERAFHAEMKANDKLRDEVARLRLALTDAHDCTAEAKAQVKKDVLALLNSQYKSPHNVSGHYSAMPCTEVITERNRLRAAIEAL